MAFADFCAILSMNILFNILNQNKSFQLPTYSYAGNSAKDKFDEIEYLDEERDDDSVGDRSSGSCIEW